MNKEDIHKLLKMKKNLLETGMKIHEVDQCLSTFSKEMKKQFQKYEVGEIELPESLLSSFQIYKTCKMEKRKMTTAHRIAKTYLHDFPHEHLLACVKQKGSKILCQCLLCEYGRVTLPKQEVIHVLAHYQLIGNGYARFYPVDFTSAHNELFQ